MTQTINEQLVTFLNESMTCFHAVHNMKQRLLKENYIELSEGTTWNLEEGKGYFVTRNNSSIIAWNMACKNYTSFHLVSSHSDSPCFKVKDNPEIVKDGYVKLNTERYGGMLMNPWFDRPLSVAGRVIVKEGNSFQTKLVNIDKDYLITPSVAPHLNRNANNGFVYNAQVDLLPILGSEDCKGLFQKQIAEYANVNEDSILASDLFVYPRDKGSIWGANNEYISSPRLDDLQCAFASLNALLQATPTTSIPVFVCFDNEEVGSLTKQGADSTFLKDTLLRINNACNKTQEDFHTTLASSFMVSADNAHAIHPNHGEMHDPINHPQMNKGIVIKHNANQKYTTDALSCAIFKDICAKANVPTQTFVNRSDAPGGSTLGNISNAHVSLNCVDIGLAQLAMHSTYETAGAKDTEYLIKALTAYYSSSLKMQDAYTYNLD